jgi:hypothetical protein
MPKHGAEYRVGGELGVPGAARIYGEIRGQLPDFGQLISGAKLSMSSRVKRGRFVFLRHRIGPWVDSGHNYEWRLISIWISSFEEGYLAKIDRVVYYLPESFADPIRTKKNRSEKFGTYTAAYGDFTVSVEVFLKGVGRPLVINRLINVNTSTDRSELPWE